MSEKTPAQAKALVKRLAEEERARKKKRRLQWRPPSREELLRKGMTETDKVVFGFMVVLIILGATVGVLWLLWPREAQVVCPPRPGQSVALGIRDYGEDWRYIAFETALDVEDDLAGFGELVTARPESYTLWVDARYDFQEVLAYLEAWDECHDERVLYIDGRLEVDIDYIGALEIDSRGPILITGPLESIVMEGPLAIQAVPVPTPTPTPDPEYKTSSIIVDEYDEDGWAEWELTPQWNYSPATLDDVLFIDCSHTLSITDAFSQTVMIAGPATVRFSDKEE